MKSLACVAVFLASVQTQGLPLHPALVTSCIAEQLTATADLDNVKLCLECFEAIEDPVSKDGITVMKVSSIQILISVFH